jgi:hypothetical protein
MNKLLILLLACSILISGEMETAYISRHHYGVVRIPSSPSSGYLWWYVPVNSALINYEGEYSGTFKKSDSLGTAEGYQEFKFECTELCSKGATVEVMFRKVRMLDNDTVEYRKFVLEVVDDTYFESK